MKNTIEHQPELAEFDITSEIPKCPLCGTEPFIVKCYIGFSREFNIARGINKQKFNPDIYPDLHILPEDTLMEFFQSSNIYDKLLPYCKDCGEEFTYSDFRIKIEKAIHSKLLKRQKEQE
jgi:hypothetical protein